MTCYFCKSPVRPWLPVGRICGECMDEFKGASVSERPEWLECESLAQALAESRTRHRGGRQLTRHQAELFWHCDQVLKENAALRAAAPEIGEDAVERAAKAIAAGRGLKWDKLNERNRDELRSDSWAALRAAQGGEK